MKTKKIFRAIDYIAVIVAFISMTVHSLLLFNFNLIESVPIINMIPKVIYGLVAASLIYIIIRMILRKFMKK